MIVTMRAATNTDQYKSYRKKFQKILEEKGLTKPKTQLPEIKSTLESLRSTYTRATNHGNEIDAIHQAIDSLIRDNEFLANNALVSSLEKQAQASKNGAVQATAVTTSESESSDVAPTKKTPSKALIVGGVAVVGIAAFLMMRKKKAA